MHQGQHLPPTGGPKASQNPFGKIPQANSATPPQDVVAAPANDGVVQAEPEKAVRKVETPAKEVKKAKKEKDTKARLVYSDNETSPEEKLARLSRYAYSPAVAT